MAVPPDHFNQSMQGAMPGFPMAGMRPPLISVPPPPVLMMPLGMPGMAPNMSTSLTSSLPVEETHSIVKPFQKPLSVSEMKVATTVFVGNITEKATDSLVRQILLRCGYIVGWKRVQNATGKLQAFGFCEYADPECTLRAMRLLNDFFLGDKKLVIKVDTKNRKELLKYLMKKKYIRSGEEYDDQILEREVDKIVLKGEANTLEEDVDDETKEEDAKVMAAIRGLVKENIDILSGGKTSDDFRRERDVHDSLVAMGKQSGLIAEDSTLDDVQMEDGMKTLVSDEIKKFRLSYQNYEEKQAEARMKRMEEKEKRKEEKSRKRSRSRSPKKRGRSKSPKKSHVVPRTRSQERREREKEREQKRKEEKLRLAKEEEEYEQKQLERKRAEKERLFKDRLRQWESREKRKAADYEYEREEEENRHVKQEKDKKRLAEFLEDYDDDKSDGRYYRGSDFSRRKEDRRIEMEEDMIDRKREREEMEALRLQVMERQVKEREEEQERKRLEAERAKSEQNHRENSQNMEEEVEIMTEIDQNVPLVKQEYQTLPSLKVQPAPSVDTPKPEIKSNPNEQTSTDIAPFETDIKVKLAFGFEKKQMSAAASRPELEGVFGGEEESDEVKPKKKIYSLLANPNSAHIVKTMVMAPSEEKMGAEDRKKLVQSLVNSIPSRREELFNYDLKWSYIDKTLMEKRVSPWINKKIIEYIGEPEPTLTEFVCNKLSENTPAEGILNDIAMVLDDEAEVFVLKLWRLLIYETEAKHLGIAKAY